MRFSDILFKIEIFFYFIIGRQIRHGMLIYGLKFVTTYRYRPGIFEDTNCESSVKFLNFGIDGSTSFSLKHFNLSKSWYPLVFGVKF